MPPETLCAYEKISSLHFYTRPIETELAPVGIMGSIQELLDCSKALETVLRSGYRARGNGLRNLAVSVRAKLPPWVFEALGTIATFRNEATHAPTFTGTAYDSIPESMLALGNYLLRELKSNRPLNGSKTTGLAKRIWHAGSSASQISDEEEGMLKIVRRSIQLLSSIASDFNGWLNKADIGDEFRKDYDFPDNEGISETFVSRTFSKHGWKIKIESHQPATDAPSKDKEKWLKTVSIMFGAE